MPLNFQLRMGELIQPSSGRKYSDGDTQFRENMLHKLDLRRRFMKHVLETRDDHLVFDGLCSEEEAGDRIWYFVDCKQAVVGPLASGQMQELWESKQIKAETLVKKKMVADFAHACSLLNKYCQLQLRKANSQCMPVHFSSPANKRVT